MSRKPAPQLPSGTRVGRVYGDCEILATLGKGGMGEVYRAVQRSLERTVAIKFISQEKYTDEVNRKRFLREIRACSALQHPNIIKIYDYGEHEKDIYLVMELLEGEPLERFIDRAPEGLPRDFVIKVAEDLLEALAYMHPQGYVHRDIKPANVFITRYNRAVLMDFGLVKIGGDAQLTQGGKMVGTPRYLPPEVLRGRMADHRGDLYQVALIMAEAMRGSLPYRQKDMAAYIRGKSKNRPPRVSECSPGLDDQVLTLLDNALEIDVSQRYPDAPSMLRDMRRVRDGKKITSSPTSVAPGFSAIFPGTTFSTRVTEGFHFESFMVLDPLITTVQARDATTGERVDLTFLSPHLRRSMRHHRSLIRDLEKLAALDHPSLATPREIIREGDCLILVTPTSRLPNLGEFLEIEPIHKPMVVAALLLPLCDALRRLQSAGLAHGFLGPHLIRIRPDGVPLLVGLELGSLSRHTLLNERSQSMVGFSFYTAPEVLEGDPADARTDIFSVGAVGFRMLTGTFAEAWGPRTEDAAVEPDTTDGAPQTTSPLEGLLVSCLARNPASRPRDLNVLLRKLGSYLPAEKAASTLQAGLGRKPDLRSKRMSRVLDTSGDGIRRPSAVRTVALAAATLMVGLGLLLVRHLDSPEPPPGDLKVVTRETEALIRWISQRAYSTRIEFGADRRGLEVIGGLVADQTTDHIVKIDRLKPDTKYLYRVVYPGEGRSIFYSFKTEAADP